MMPDELRSDCRASISNWSAKIMACASRARPCWPASGRCCLAFVECTGGHRNRVSLLLASGQIRSI